mgnify:CR=1 FL=1
MIGAFLSQGDELGQDPMDVAAPQANAYEFQSQGIIDLLEKLEDKFQDERDTLEKEETNSWHAYQMLMQDLQSQLDSATTAREEKSEETAKSLQLAAAARGAADALYTGAARAASEAARGAARGRCSDTRRAARRATGALAICSRLGSRPVL